MCVIVNVPESLTGQKGQGMVEYALIIAFVVAVSVALFVTRPELAQGIGAIMDRAANLLESL